MAEITNNTSNLYNRSRLRKATPLLSPIELNPFPTLLLLQTRKVFCHVSTNLSTHTDSVCSQRRLALRAHRRRKPRERLRRNPSRRERLRPSPKLRRRPWLRARLRPKRSRRRRRTRISRRTRRRRTRPTSRRSIAQPRTPSSSGYLVAVKRSVSFKRGCESFMPRLKEEHGEMPRRDMERWPL